MYDTLQSVVYYIIRYTIVLSFLTVLITSDKLRYYFKFWLFLLLLQIVPSLCIPYVLFNIGDWRNAVPTTWSISIYQKIIGLRFIVRGKGNIIQNSGSIVLINHQSMMDICVLSELWLVLENCTVIAKKSVLYAGLAGISCWLWGIVFIDRKKTEVALSTLKAMTNKIKASKKRVMVFPEGHRYSETTLRSFKKGAFHMAIDAQLPIQPVVVSKFYFLNYKLKRFDSGTSYITILPPISTEGLTKQDLPKLMADTYGIMNKAFQETSAESLNEHIRELIGE